MKAIWVAGSSRTCSNSHYGKVSSRTCLWQQLQRQCVLSPVLQTPASLTTTHCKTASSPAITGSASLSVVLAKKILNGAVLMGCNLLEPRRNVCRSAGMASGCVGGFRRSVDCPLEVNVR